MKENVKTPLNSELTSPAGQVQPAIENVAQNYLETLDALTIVYEAAGGLAQLFDRSSIAQYTLQGTLDALELDCGAVFLEEGGELQFHLDSSQALAWLKTEALRDASLAARPLFKNGSEAQAYLKEEAEGKNILLAPVFAAQNALGLVVALSEESRRFTTKDLKLVSAVTSQAAIAMSGSRHLEKIVDEKRELHSIIESNKEGIIILDEKGNTKLINKVAADILGMGTHVKTGLPFIKQIQAWNQRGDFSALSRGELDEFDLEISRESNQGTRVVSIQVNRLQNENTGTQLTVLNLRETSHDQREMASMNRFLSQMAAAIHQPADSLREAIGSAETGGEEKAPCATEVERLCAQVEHFRNYVTVLDETSRKTEGADLSSIANDARDECLTQFAAQAPSVELRIDESAVRVAAPQRTLNLILKALLDNAVRFAAKDKTTITISTYRCSEDRIAIAIEDQGPGLPAPIHDAIFESHELVTETSMPNGSGAGLLFVREAVRRIRGGLEYREARQGGAIITVLLPASR